MALAILECVGIAAVFAGLGWWALYQPLPAVVVGLILYVTLTLAGFVANPELALRGVGVKVFIIVGLLAQAVALRRGRKATDKIG
jgi:hypothetical protein